MTGRAPCDSSVRSALPLLPRVNRGDLAEVNFVMRLGGPTRCVLACWRVGVLACWRVGVLACWRVHFLVCVAYWGLVPCHRASERFRCLLRPRLALSHSRSCSRVRLETTPRICHRGCRHRLPDTTTRWHDERHTDEAPTLCPSGVVVPCLSAVARPSKAGSR